MARFLYQARTGKGELTNGVVAADTLEAAGQMLRTEGKFIVRLSQVADIESNDAALSLDEHSRRCRREDVIFFAHQMAVMIETGVPISEALDCLLDQAANAHFKEVLRGVAEYVQAGGELSVALKKFPRVFPSLMVSLVKAGEVSGTMGTMLERISKYLGKEQATRRQVRGALMYPLFMMGMALTVTVFLLAFVLPRFAKIYESRQATLPAPTRLLLGMSNALVDYWYLWVLLAAAGIAAGMVTVRTDSGRRGLDWLKLNTPVFRHLFTQLYVTRACRTLGTMLSSGVSMLDAIEIVRQVTNNAYYQDLWDQVDDALKQGLQLSDPLFKSPLIPRSIAQMVRSGEKSGRLGLIMNRIAEHSEAEFDDAVKTTTQFIEPAMVMFMGGVVGFVAISLLLPIFSVSKVVAS